MTKVSESISYFTLHKRVAHSFHDAYAAELLRIVFLIEVLTFKTDQSLLSAISRKRDANGARPLSIGRN